MKITLFPLLLFLFGFQLIDAQVKIGTSPNIIDAGSIVELESSNKALVLTRLTNAEMSSLAPLNGAIVYNTEAKCIFVYEGTVWKNLCGSGTLVTTSPTGPTTNNMGDIWINDASGLVSVWDGTTWVPINTGHYSGIGEPLDTTIDNPLIGDIYVDNNTGEIYIYNGSDWTNQSSMVGNGLSKSQDTIQLGGNLIQSTTIHTDAINTLAISGLEQVEPAGHQIVLVDENTGVLRKTSTSSFTQQEEVVIIANDGQIQFNTPLPFTDSKKIEVYRNGIKIGFTPINATLIELETNIICYQDDEIRIVQLF